MVSNCRSPLPVLCLERHRLLGVFTWALPRRGFPWIFPQDQNTQGFSKDVRGSGWNQGLLKS